ncbi:unnamed protein product, partial [Heterotrigona itama]
MDLPMDPPRRSHRQLPRRPIDPPMDPAMDLPMDPPRSPHRQLPRRPPMDPPDFDPDEERRSRRRGSQLDVKTEPLLERNDSEVGKARNLPQIYQNFRRNTNPIYKFMNK